jgi:PAS domain S-box-containing protein
MSVHSSRGGNVLVFDARGIVEDVSEPACTLLGYSRTELVGLHGSELIPREAQPATAATVDRMRRGEVVACAGRIRRKDGGMIGVSVTSRLLEKGRLAIDLHPDATV